MSSAPLRRALAPALVATLVALPALAQTRPVAAPPPAGPRVDVGVDADLKTPAEPSAPAPSRPRTERVAGPGAPDAASASPVRPADLPRGIDRSVVHWDEPGDGTLWARGVHYKMSFDERGATYWPLFGKDQERHVPLALSPRTATLGGAPLVLDAPVAAVRDGDRVTIARGPFAEVYELAPGSIEQLFVVERLERAGELAIDVPLAEGGAAALDLAARETAEGLELEHALGRVVYGTAALLDPDGGRRALPTRLDRGTATIRVGAELLRDAELPLVVDPVVGTFPIDTTTLNDYFADCAYDAQTQRWLVVFEEYVTASDSDVYYVMCNVAGVGMWGSYVNSNNASWEDPRCANLYSATQFLVVAGVDGSGTRTIRGRTVEADIASMGGEFTISGSESGPKYFPAVGGDPYFAQPASYCVVWEREFASFTDYDIHARLVNPDGSMGALITLSNSGSTSDKHPAVSRSNGGSSWTVVWERIETGAIWGGRIDYNGSVVSTPFQITSAESDQYPSVSSPLIGSQRTLVAYQRDFGTDFDIGLTLLDGAAAVGHMDLSTQEGITFVNDQRQPSVDSDGHHFLVAYQERPSPSVSWDVLCSDVRAVDTALEVAEARLPLATSTAFEGVVRVASAQGSSGPSRRYMATWHAAGSGGNDVHGALIDGNLGGTVTPFCLGDGTDGACPCNNDGAPGNGCGRAGNPAGASLDHGGSASTWGGTLTLSAQGLPGAGLCIFLQTTGTAPAVPFADGIGCLNGTTVRLASKNASFGRADFPEPGATTPLHHAGGVPLDGGVRTYQVWYRNSPDFCTAAPSNVTNGLLVRWSR